MRIDNQLTFNLENIKSIHELHNKIHDITTSTNSNGTADYLGLNYDKERVTKKIINNAEKSDVVVIGQALAKNTERLSGLAYTMPQGNLSPSGILLDNFLGLFGYTIDVKNTDKKIVYSTDIYKNFPGKVSGGNGDIKPSAEQVKLNIPLLKKEFEFLNPKVILLLGKITSKNFLHFFANSKEKINLYSGEARTLLINGKEVDVYAIPHPAGSQYRYNQVRETYLNVAKKICKMV